MGRQVKVTFVLADTHRTSVAIQFENEHIPFLRRTVTIELTPEQVAQLSPRRVGIANGVDAFEETLTCWLENEPKPEASK
jgi:hypothetical protein